jgi:hypothetical protein
MGQQVKYGDAVAQTACEFRNDFGDRRGERQPAAFDGLKDQDVRRSARPASH